MESVSKLAPGAGRRAEKQWRARGSSFVRPREFRVKGHGVIYLGSQSAPLSLVISPLIRREPRAQRQRGQRGPASSSFPASPHMRAVRREISGVFSQFSRVSLVIWKSQGRGCSKKRESRFTTQRSGSSPSNANEEARLRASGDYIARLLDSRQAELSTR